ncbi:ATP-dependent helicase [Xanthocytophaga flava]|uniref:ATP-dependent helicase n=1 Tax=Xanthocytophaga flava TaxID=3048013 RepID=UPI0028D3F1FF|nr:ATP-dependent helicase [Xanthocytophaga flavus]MDJ1473799.1 ATP-dependent helicase [Xanthocytophaga flavus]
MDLFLTNPEVIHSNSIIEIEQHYKLSAGPGAGKTHWLINHIKNVLSNSTRLGKTRKIACITYTNIAVETILSRLGQSTIQVEVSTIHSFLFRHVIKPYIAFIASDYKLDVTKISGHDEHIISFKKVMHWIENHPNNNQLKHPNPTPNQLLRMPQNKEALVNWLSTLTYKLSQKEEIYLHTDKGKAYSFDENGNRGQGLSRRCLDILDLGLLKYKELYWQEGILHHDDILFFSYHLIIKYPFILKVIRAKFPYFFIDEFQDTNPIQAYIIKSIGQEETVIGVIGDIAQSIYEFQGAEPSHFENFFLKNISYYTIEDNHRSTSQIIAVLNNFRSDLRQKNVVEKNGERPKIIIGKKASVYKYAEGLCEREQLYSLSRRNITANSLNKSLNSSVPTKDLLDKRYNKDSNKDRRRFVVSSIKAVELALNGLFNDALKSLEWLFQDETDINKGKKEALKSICLLLSLYDTFKDDTLYNYYSNIIKRIKADLSDLRTGEIKSFYETHTYKQLAVCVKNVDEVTCHKTIHKSKGDEFDNVLVILEKGDVEYLLKPGLLTEEQRIIYVALSRAKNRLFINLPELPDNYKKILENRGFEIVSCEEMDSPKKQS